MTNLETEHPRNPVAWIVVATALLSLAVASRVGMIAWPFLNDAGLYACLGKTVAQGGVLYRDFYETKLPGVALLASIFWRVFGSCWAGYVLGQLALALLAALLLGRAARRHIAPAAALPTFLFAAVFLNFAWAVYTGFQLETIQAFFEALAALAALEAIGGDRLPDSLAAGMAAAMAAMLKPSGLAVGLAFAVTLLITRTKTGGIRRSLAHLAAFIAGAAIPILVTVIYVIRSGIWPYLPGVMHQIERYADATPLGADVLLKLIVVMLAIGFPMMVRALGSRKQTATLLEPPAESYVLLFALAWFLADLIGIILQRRMYLYHFLPLACPAALLYGLLPRPARPMQVALGLLPIALLSLRWEGTDLSHIDRGFQHQPLSKYISAHTSPGDSVYADQIGRLLIETDRAPGSRFGTFFYFANYDDAPTEYGHALLRDFQERRPKYVVLRVSNDSTLPTMANGAIMSEFPARRENFLRAWGRIDAYLHHNYTVETTIDGNRVFRRRDADALADTSDR